MTILINDEKHGYITCYISAVLYGNHLLTEINNLNLYVVTRQRGGGVVNLKNICAF